MKRCLRLLLPLLVVTAALTGARADDVPAEAEAREAARLVQEANRIGERGGFARALELYREAFRRDPKPNTLLGVATMLLELGREVEAADTYQRFLEASGPSERRREEVLRTLRDLDRRLGVIEIDVSEAGARVRVDGRDLGSSPLPGVVRVKPGRYVVAAEKPAFASAAIEVTVKRGDRDKVVVRLDPSEPDAPPAPEPALPPPLPVGAPPPPLAPASGGAVVDALSPAPGGALRVAGLVSAGAGVVAIGAGVYFGLEAQRLSDGVAQVYVPADLERARAANRMMIASYAIGGAALVTGSVLYLVGVRQRARGGVIVTPTANGAAASWGF